MNGNNKNINEVLKEKERLEAQKRISGAADADSGLDSLNRVKVLSPMQLVFKRFIRNKLAIIGTVILVIMFIFSFVGPIFYPYGQTEKMYKFDLLENANYAQVSERVSFEPFVLSEYDIPVTLNALIISKLGKSDYEVVSENNVNLALKRLDAHTYSVSPLELKGVAKVTTVVGTYNSFDKKFSYTGADMSAEFEAAVAAAISGNKTVSFSFDGVNFTVAPVKGVKFTYEVTYADGPMILFEQSFNGNVDATAAAISTAIQEGNTSFEIDDVTYTVKLVSEGNYSVGIEDVKEPVRVYSNYTIDAVDHSSTISNEFKAIAFSAMGNGEGEKSFSFDGVDYSIVEDEEGNTVVVNKATNTNYGVITNFIVRRPDGNDNFSIDFKNEVSAIVADMKAAGLNTQKVTCQTIEAQAEDASIMKDENGNTVYKPADISITLKNNVYEVRCDRIQFLIDRFAAPGSDVSREFHLLGTDGDGYDLLARMMYGGRVSLLVGFIVVIIETILGVIMGGIAGYFGGFIDSLIMRLVDVFYCIPSMPLLIILGAFFDKTQMPPYTRLAWMMALLGFLGWAGIARLVRGQILSLREQEFMVATEATGVRVSRRIFRHLVPNVMPQLIVSATMGLGSVILTESTLSFLGLGVKHPLATWGTMINSVSDYSSMVSHAYIWVPVGMLICLTVIAFNFVGDGLRDAFDPKMKR